MSMSTEQKQTVSFTSCGDLDSTLCFQISSNGIHSLLTFSAPQISKDTIIKLVNAQKNNEKYSISYKSKSNQDVTIFTTLSGLTGFSLSEDARDTRATNFEITLPNQYCIPIFEKLI